MVVRELYLVPAPFTGAFMASYRVNLAVYTRRNYERK
jgi:hypothetical protein